MDKKFLNRVLEQIVSEINVDYVKGTIRFPFLNHFSLPIRYIIEPSNKSPWIIPQSSFDNHCRDIYSLNESEIRYVCHKFITMSKHLVNEQIIVRMSIH
jgi:hypothetical protein